MNAIDPIVAVLAALSTVSAGLAAWLAVLLIRARDSRRAADARSRSQLCALEDELASRTAAEAEIRRAKLAAETANEAKTRYLVGVSHEIRSPLNAIYGYAQLLERDDAMSGAEAGAVIRRSAEHLTNLVEGLLDIARIESGVLKIRSDLVELPVFLDSIIDMFRMQAAAKGLSLDLVARDRLPTYVKVDEKRLRQILINLLSNAIKYTRDGGVTITVGYRSQVADIEVRDTGVGIAADDLERIFQPFERGSSHETSLQPGIGLGLAITRVLTGILGGDILATSTPGSGSSFRLRIMLPEPADTPDAGVQGSKIIGYDGHRRTVLVIDDDTAQGTVLKSLLQPLGFAVQLACTGADGLDLAERETPDIVLLDIQMPGLNGWETAARLRKRHGNRLSIVMVSANVHEFRAGGDGDSNHDAFITKPVDLDALLGVIRAQLNLKWRLAKSPAPPAQDPGAAHLPPEADGLVERLHGLAKVGHVRGIENALDELEAKFPDAAGFAAGLRRHVNNFDIKSLVKALGDVEPR